MSMAGIGTARNFAITTGVATATGVGAMVLSEKTINRSGTPAEVERREERMLVRSMAGATFGGGAAALGAIHSTPPAGRPGMALLALGAYVGVLTGVAAGGVATLT